MSRAEEEMKRRRREQVWIDFIIPVAVILSIIAFFYSIFHKSV